MSVHTREEAGEPWEAVSRGLSLSLWPVELSAGSGELPSLGAA